MEDPKKPKVISLRTGKEEVLPPPMISNYNKDDWEEIVITVQYKGVRGTTTRCTMKTGLDSLDPAIKREKLIEQAEHGAVWLMEQLLDDLTEE